MEIFGVEITLIKIGIGIALIGLGIIWLISLIIYLQKNYRKIGKSSNSKGTSKKSKK